MNPSCSSFRLRSAVALLLLAAALPLHAQTYDWNNALGGTWSTPGNWSPLGPPTLASTARLNLATTYTISVTSSVNVNTLTVNNGEATLNLGGNTVQFPNTTNGGVGGTLRVNSGNFSMGGIYVGSNNGSTAGLYLDMANTASSGTGGISIGSGGTGILSVRGLSTLTTNGAASIGTNGTGTATVYGTGAQWTANSLLAVGNNANGTLNILNGGFVTSTALEIGKSPGSTGHLVLSGAGSTFTTAGNVNIGGAFAPDPAASAVLDIAAGATVNFNGNTNFRTTATLNMAGGTLNLNTLTTAPGTAVNWTGGKIQFASAASLTDPILDTFLDGTHTLGAGRTLAVVSGTVDLNSALQVNGGTLTAPDINVNAPLLIGAFGSVSAANMLTLSAGKTLQIGDFGVLGAGTAVFNNGGLIQPDGINATITGFTANLAGTVQGTGRFAGGLNNGTTGTIRARDGDYLIVEQTGLTNSGRIELSGGTIEYTKPLSNLGTGIISGRGEFRTNTSQTGLIGLANNGLIALSGGLSDFRGDVQNNPGGHIITSGGAIVTFYDDLKHNGAEFKVSAASSVVCFGVVSGAGSFTGSGTFYMEGGYSPGNSPAAVTIGANLVLGDDNLLILELGGYSAGSGYDQLILDSGATLTAGGDLKISLIDGFVPTAGDSFQVLRFGNSSQITGGFDSVTLDGTLAPGMWLDASALLQNGVISVVPEPSSSLFLALGGACLFLRRSRPLRAPRSAGARARRIG